MKRRRTPFFKHSRFGIFKNKALRLTATAAFFAICISGFQNCDSTMRGSGLITADAPTLAKPSVRAASRLAFSSVSASPATRVIDSSSGGHAYVYGPAMVYTDGKYHVFVCGEGTSGVDDWDHIRHVSSSDGVNWSGEDTVLVSDSGDISNCDPSVIKFNAGDGDYYYMMYSGVRGGLTVNYLARSRSITGPYLKYTDRGTWETAPSDNFVITSPLFNIRGKYGAGQSSLVVMGNRVAMFYTDDTNANYDGQPAVCLDSPDNGCAQPRIYLTQSADLIHWTVPVATNVYNFSIDVKFDDARGLYLLSEILSEHTVDSMLALRTSPDGVVWTAAQTICDTNCFPHYSNNVGMSGDSSGHIIPGFDLLVAYGAPWDLSPNYSNHKTGPEGWGAWDLYSTRVVLPPAPSIVGTIDGIDNNYLIGWACLTTVDSPIDVHVYAGGAAGTPGATFMTSGTANVASEPAIASACQTSARNYRFKIDLNNLPSPFTGQKIYVHGLSPMGSANLLLGGSGTLVVPAHLAPAPTATPPPMPTATPLPVATPRPAPTPAPPVMTPPPAATPVHTEPQDNGIPRARVGRAKRQ